MTTPKFEMGSFYEPRPAQAHVVPALLVETDWRDTPATVIEFLLLMVAVGIIVGIILAGIG